MTNGYKQQTMIKLWCLIIGLLLLQCAGYGQSSHVDEIIEDDRFNTDYVSSYQELIMELEKRDRGVSVFFVSYDEAGHVIHAVPMLVPNLIELINRYQCEMPPFCVVLLANGAIRKTK